MSAHTVISHAQNPREGSAAIQSLRAAVRTASDARRMAEADVRNYVPGADVTRRAADLAEMDAYLALFDARHAPSPMGVSLVKPGDPVQPSVPAPTGPIREQGDDWVSYVPRAEWAELITAALCHSQYAYASALSEQFHAPE